MKKVKIDQELNKNQRDLVKQMAEAGVHFGHGKSNRHPKIKPHIFAFKSNVYIVDLTSTVKRLEQALDFIKNTVKSGGTILFVGIQPQIQKATQETAKECQMPYITERWLGGTLTNFKTIHNRIKHLRDLEQKKKAGELSKYTKKEQVLFNQEIQKLNKNLGGLKNLDKLPDAVLVMSIKENQGAVKEARRKNIPIIGLADTDTDPSQAEYFIPANDDGISSLKFMLEQFKKAIIQNKGHKKTKTETQKNDKSTTSKTT